MKITTRSSAPSWAPNALLSKAGWINPKNGEVYVPSYKLDENELFIKESQPATLSKEDKVTISSKKPSKKKKSNTKSVVESPIQPATTDAFSVKDSQFEDQISNVEIPLGLEL